MTVDPAAPEGVVVGREPDDTLLLRRAHWVTAYEQHRRAAEANQRAADQNQAKADAAARNVAAIDAAIALVTGACTAYPTGDHGDDTCSVHGWTEPQP